MAISVRAEQVASLFSEGVEEAPLTPTERRKRRAGLLRESLFQRLTRLDAALAYATRRKRLSALAATLDFLARARSIAPANLPNPEQALARPDGLCGLAADLSPAGMVEAYSYGLTLFGPIGPPAWWSPSRRWVARPGALRAPEASRGGSGFQTSLDRAFDETVAACSRPDRSASRLGFGPKLMRAWSALYDAGFAHSFEVLNPEGKLVAGGFGLSLGKVFVTEGCFGPPELLGVALARLDGRLADWGYVMHEARLGASPAAAPPAFVRDLGFEPLARQAYVQTLRANLCGGRLSRWRIDRELPEQEDSTKARGGERPYRYASAA